MHFPQAMRHPRHATPLLPLVVWLLMYCVSGCIAAAPAPEPRCGFDEMMMRGGPLPTAVVREVPRKGQGAMQAYTVATREADDSGEWAPIRIKVFTEELKASTRKREMKSYCEKAKDECLNHLGQKITCEERHILSESKKKLYEEKIIPGAVKLHAERLLVKPVADKITVPRDLGDLCRHFKIPADHIKDGVSGADFIIYAAAGPSGTSSKPVWAATCGTMSDLRPSIGAMNFDPQYMTDTAWSVRVAAHELAHALGFSQEGMEKKIVNSENIVRGKRRKMMVGDNVQKKARLHFGCGSLKGMELEDDDDRERGIPHWKERNARDELMASTVGAGYYTALTLAVFADMEYYRVNWSMAEPMSWGSNTGCDFLEKKCKDTKDLFGLYPRMFCDGSDTTTLRCTSDRRHVGTCTAHIVEQKGDSQAVDDCPVVSSGFYTVASGTTYNTCSDEKVTSLPGSLTGSGSWCLDAESLVVPKKEGDGDSSAKTVKGVCAKVSCEEGTVKVKYLGSTDDWHECPEGGEIQVTLEGFSSSGKIKCPKYGEVCTIAADGSSLVIPSALEDDKEDATEDQENGVQAPGSPPGDTRPQDPSARGSSSVASSGAAAAGGAVGGLPATPKTEPEVRVSNEAPADNRERGERSVGTGEGASGLLNPGDGGVAAAAAGFSPLVLFAVATAAVAVMPL